MLQTQPNILQRPLIQWTLFPEKPASVVETKVISRPEAIAFLLKMRSYSLGEIWNGSGFVRGDKRKVSRHQRGAGAAVDVINYGLFKDGEMVAVARIGMTPYEGAPARKAVGDANAPYTFYLMRQCALGVTHEELVTFIRTYTGRLRGDLEARNHKRVARKKKPYDPRYLLSLDDPNDRIIVNDIFGVLVDSMHASGKIYVEADALYAGQTKTKQKAAYVDRTGKIRSIYRCGKNRLDEARANAVQILEEGEKHRFVWVLAPKGSLEYAAWRRVLPAWVVDPIWGVNTGFVQPRMLSTQIQTVLDALQAVSRVRPGRKEKAYAH